MDAYVGGPAADIDASSPHFQRAVGDCQVRAPERLLVSQLEAAGVSLDKVRRYRVAWRAECTAKIVPATMGVPHGGDLLPHNFGIAYGATERDREVMDAWIEDTVSGVRDRLTMG